MSIQNSTVEIQFPLYATRRPPRESSPSEAPPSGSGNLPRVTQVMALAIQFQDMIQRGDARDYADLARLGCLTRERMSQIMELVWLAPEIMRDILYLPPTLCSRYPISEHAVRKIASLPCWRDQQVQWSELKQTHHLD